MESPLLQTRDQEIEHHLEWIRHNNLDERLYQICIDQGFLPKNILLERSIKVDTKTLNIISEKRYVVCDTSPTLKTTNDVIRKCIESYSPTNVTNFMLAFNSIYEPTERHHLYVGLDKNTFKAGMDYINKCLVGVASIQNQCFFRQYNLFNDDSWYEQLNQYVQFYKNRLNSLVIKAYSEAMDNCKLAMDKNIYIKQDHEGLVFHMNVKQFKIPQFELFLKTLPSKFNEKFTWISINDQLDKLTLYIRPIFKN